MDRPHHPAPDVVLPHAPLARYYGQEQHRRRFLRRLFDDTAAEYDRVECMMAFGTGSWYRRQALKRAGLLRGMKVLDVAVGTGLVAREAALIVGDPRQVIGIDPSPGMLVEATRSVAVRLVIGRAEELPVKPAAFDFLSMGYALRHVSDLTLALGEFFRALRPGGTVCLLEITRPRGFLTRALMRCYMKGVVPCLSRLTSRRADPQLLWEYYWDTIDKCVEPEEVLNAMSEAGFHDCRRHVEIGIFSEYTGRRPLRNGRDS